VPGFEGTGYLVSRVWGTWFRGYGVPGFEATGYLVSRVRGTWFPVWGTGYTVSNIQVSGFESMGLSS